MTANDLLPAVRAIYARHLAGCCLHIVLDDGNLEDSSVDVCIAHSIREGHAECETLARNIRSLTGSQRRLLRHLHRQETP